MLFFLSRMKYRITHIIKKILHTPTGFTFQGMNVKEYSPNVTFRMFI